MHLEVRSLAVFFAGKLDESILKAVSCLLVSDDFAREDLAKPGENELQILVSSHRVELADEQDLFGRCNIRER